MFFLLFTTALFLAFLAGLVVLGLRFWEEAKILREFEPTAGVLYVAVLGSLGLLGLCPLVCLARLLRGLIRVAAAREPHEITLTSNCITLHYQNRPDATWPWSAFKSRKGHTLLFDNGRLQLPAEMSLDGLSRLSVLASHFAAEPPRPPRSACHQFMRTFTVAFCCLLPLLMQVPAMRVIETWGDASTNIVQHAIEFGGAVMCGCFVLAALAAGLSTLVRWFARGAQAQVNRQRAERKSNRCGSRPAWPRG